MIALLVVVPCEKRSATTIGGVGIGTIPGKYCGTTRLPPEAGSSVKVVAHRGSNTSTVGERHADEVRCCCVAKYWYCSERANCAPSDSVRRGLAAGVSSDDPT